MRNLPFQEKAIDRLLYLKRGSKAVGFLLMGLYLLGCQAKVGTIPVLDTPAHHTEVGMRLLERGKPDQALREFSLAKSLDPSYGPAYLGTGVVYRSQGDFPKAFAELQEAKKNAQTTDQKISAGAEVIATQRQAFLSGQAENDWLKVSEREFAEGLRQSGDLAALYYAMGRAYLTAYEFLKAEEMFRKVVSLDGLYAKSASAELAIIDKVKQFLREEQK